MPPPEFITQSPRARRDTETPRQSLPDLSGECSEPLCKRYQLFSILALRVRIEGLDRLVRRNAVREEGDSACVTWSSGAANLRITKPCT
jgi:hypothetical protein